MEIGVIEEAVRAGSFSMQVLLLSAIIILAGVIAYLHKDNKKTFRAFREEMSEKEEKMHAERISRVEMLVGIIKDHTETSRDLKNAIDNNTKSIEHNTHVTERFELLLNNLIDKKLRLKA